MIRRCLSWGTPWAVRCRVLRQQLLPSCTAVPELQQGTNAVDALKIEILQAVSQLQESIDQTQAAKVPEPNILIVLVPLALLSTLLFVDFATGALNEAVELSEYDRNPRFLVNTEGKEPAQRGRRLRNTGKDIKTLMLQGVDETQLKLPVKEQLVLEQVVRRNADVVAMREAQIVFLIFTWVLFSQGAEAFFRTPDAPLQP